MTMLGVPCRAASLEMVPPTLTTRSALAASLTESTKSEGTSNPGLGFLSYRGINITSPREVSLSAICSVVSGIFLAYDAIVSICLMTMRGLSCSLCLGSQFFVQATSSTPLNWMILLTPNFVYSCVGIAFEVIKTSTSGKANLLAATA